MKKLCVILILFVGVLISCRQSVSDDSDPVPVVKELSFRNEQNTADLAVYAYYKDASDKYPSDYYFNKITVDNPTGEHQNYASNNWLFFKRESDGITYYNKTYISTGTVNFPEVGHFTYQKSASSGYFISTSWDHTYILCLDFSQAAQEGINGFKWYMIGDFIGGETCDYAITDLNINENGTIDRTYNSCYQLFTWKDAL